MISCLLSNWLLFFIHMFSKIYNIISLGYEKLYSHSLFWTMNIEKKWALQGLFYFHSRYGFILIELNEKCLQVKRA
jgi:hypothetical protein